MTTTPDNARAYELRADESRRRLASTLDELADNLTPGRVLDEVMSYARGGGANFLKSLGNAASANPIPVALIGISAAMLLTGRGRVGSNGSEVGRATESRGAGGLGHAIDRISSARPSGRSVLDDGSGTSKVAGMAGSVIGDGAAAVGSAASSMIDTVGSATASAAKQASVGAAAVGSLAADAMEQARDGAAAVGSAVASTSQKAADAAARGVEAVGETVGELADAARKTVGETGASLFERGSRIGADIGERTKKIVEEQPLLVAAAGLAIGAAIAAALPRTKVEDSLMGDTSDVVKDAVGQLAINQFDAAKSTAETVAEEIKKTASEAGLSPAAAAGAIQDLGDKLKEAVISPVDAPASRATEEDAFQPTSAMLGSK